VHSSRKKWLQFSLFNLFLVALLGLILRYKIAFSLPFIDQQFLLHGHSHFAFAGWVTQALMTLLIGYLSEKTNQDHFPKYRWILYFNAITAYGMLISFPIQGYGFVSILFSTLSVFASYYFVVFFWKDLNRILLPSPAHSWFKVALLGNAISSAGPFSLAYMMASHHMQQNLYLASIYFYLHFQYNVWFFFTCMGLASYRLAALGFDENNLSGVFRLFALAALPTYFLSVLWWHLPVWLYIIVVMAAFCQLAGWVHLLWLAKKKAAVIRSNITPFSRILFIFFGVALSIKLVLQTASVIPAVSHLAFGFRPIVIGYLHLILLGIITLFIITYSFTFREIHIHSGTKPGMIVFVAGIIYNELLLMIQGVSDLFDTGVPGISLWLFSAAAMLVCGAGIMVYHQLFSKDDCNHKMKRKEIRVL
jgi:hypothetical protein